MLPSFRLIIATFLGSFLLVFVGLRFIAPLVHEPVFVRLSAGAPIAALNASDGGIAAIFDMRFPASDASDGLVPASLTLHPIDRAAPPRTERPSGEAVAPPDSSSAAPNDDALSSAVTRPAAGPAISANAPDYVVPELPGIEPVPVARIEVAALPDPVTPTDPPPNKERSPALTEYDTGSPQAVATAGTSRPVAKPPRRAKPKVVRPARLAAQARTARTRTTPRPAAAAGTNSNIPAGSAPPTNPFSFLFGSPQ